MMMKRPAIIFIILLLFNSCGAEKTKLKCNGCALTISAVNDVTFTNIITDEVLPNSCSSLITESGTAAALSGTFNSTVPITSGIATHNSVCTTCALVSSAGALIEDEIGENVDTVDTAQIINITNDFPNLGQTCSVSIPTISVNCSSTTFTIENADISGISDSSFSISMDVTKFDGQGASLTSNSVSINRLYIKQVSNMDTEIASDLDTDDEIQEMFIFNNELFFIGEAPLIAGCPAGVNERKLHKITSNTISVISDTNSGSHDFAVAALEAEEFNSKLYFKMNAGGFNQIFSFAGNALEQINYFSAFDANATSFATYGGKLYFYADTSASNYLKLFSLDTSNDLLAVASTSSDGIDTNRSDNNTALFTFGGNLYFDGDSENSGNKKLYKLAVSSPNVTQVSNFLPGLDDFPVSTLDSVEFNSTLYVVALNSSGKTKLFSYDGSTFKVFSNTSGSTTTDDDPQDFIAYNGSLYFTALDSNLIPLRHLYKTDGITITKLKESSGDDGIEGDQADDPSEFYIFDNELYYSSKLSSGKTKLFKTNGTDVTQISHINDDDDDNGTLGDKGDDNPTQLVELNDELYFVAYRSGTDEKLYKYDGTTIYQLTNYAGADSDDIDLFLEFEDELYFSMTDTLAKKLFKVTETP